jgi:hypothetical protein
MFQETTIAPAGALPSSPPSSGRMTRPCFIRRMGRGPMARLMAEAAGREIVPFRGCHTDDALMTER